MEISESQLTRFRAYLRTLARIQIHGGDHCRMDASDVAQEAILRAWRDRAQFRGQTEGEMASWLRAILAHTIANARRSSRRIRRDVRLERSIEAQLEDSSDRVTRWVAANIESPSSQVSLSELLQKVEAAMDLLPEAQRRAVELRHWNGLGLKEIASRMGRSPGAVGLLIHRGMEALRQSIRERRA